MVSGAGIDEQRRRSGSERSRRRTTAGVSDGLRCTQHTHTAPQHARLINQPVTPPTHTGFLPARPRRLPPRSRSPQPRSKRRAAGRPNRHHPPPSTLLRRAHKQQQPSCPPSAGGGRPRGRRPPARTTPSGRCTRPRSCSAAWSRATSSSRTRSRSWGPWTMYARYYSAVCLCTCQGFAHTTGINGNNNDRRRASRPASA